MKVYQNQSVLRKLHWQGELGVSEIASQFGVTSGTIAYWMDKFGIRRRSPGEANRTTRKRERVRQSNKAAWVRGCYVGVFDTPEHRQKMSDSVREAHRRGCYDEDYKLRSSRLKAAHAQSEVYGEAWRHKISQTNRRKRRAAAPDVDWDLLDDSSWLYERYIVDGESASSLSIVIGCCPMTVLYALREHDIPVRGSHDHSSPSTGERLLIRLFDSLGVLWEREVPLEGTRTKKRWAFDFSFPETSIVLEFMTTWSHDPENEYLVDKDRRKFLDAVDAGLDPRYVWGLYEGYRAARVPEFNSTWGSRGRSLEETLQVAIPEMFERQ